jgi:hypothetical protein
MDREASINRARDGRYDGLATLESPILKNGHWGNVAWNRRRNDSEKATAP